MFWEPKDGMRPPPLKHSPFNAIVAPRPIGWISTVDAAGAVNLAPYSYFNAVSGEPPCVMYCANGRHADGGQKDSLTNVREVPEFVFNLCTWGLHEQMNLTAAHLPRSIDEMGEAGLAAAPSVKVRPPRIAAAKAALECEVVTVVALPDGRNGITNNLIVGRVIGIHLDDDVIVDGRVDVLKLRPVARLGYFDYATADSLFEMLRPD